MLNLLDKTNSKLKSRDEFVTEGESSSSRLGSRSSFINDNRTLDNRLIKFRLRRFTLLQFRLQTKKNLN